MEKTLKDKTTTDVVLVHQVYPVKDGVVTLPDGAKVDESLFGEGGSTPTPPASGDDSNAGTAKADKAKAK